MNLYGCDLTLYHSEHSVTIFQVKVIRGHEVQKVYAKFGYFGEATSHVFMS